MTGREASTRTTVMVLTFNGSDHLEGCLDSLGRLDVFVPGSPGRPADPASPDEVWVVDNASTDGSVGLVRSRFPWVRVVPSDTNLGFSRAYNRAAAMAASESVVFLNDDMRVDPGFLSVLHATRGRHPEAKAVAARIMNWNGSRVDFEGADTFFTGHAWQRGLGEPAEGRSFRESRLLFGCAGALLVQRAGFLGIGGFDPDYFSFFEDVDLGWRLALAGDETWLAPEAVAFHKHHGSWGRQPVIRISYLTDRNALFTTFKNYHDDRMGVMLLIAAALTFLRGCSSAGALHDRGRPFLSSIAIAHMLALADLSAHLPGLRRRREQVQATRRRSDEEILPLFGAFASPPAYLGEGYLAAVRGLCEAAGITDRDPGGPFPPEINAEAREIAVMLAETCARYVGETYPSRSFVSAGWEPDWEHEIGPLAARVLSDVRWALTGFAATRITAESLHALREVLEYAGQEGAVPVLPAPALRSFGETVATAGGPERFAVSVVIRTKDRPDSLGRALRSVAAQTLLPAEVVVVNDGGADPSPVLAGFSDRFPVALVGFPASIGRSRAAQAGLEAATGTHVLFLDDDDDLRAEHLRTLADAIADEGVRAAYTDVECVAEEKDGTGATRTVARGSSAARSTRRACSSKTRSRSWRCSSIGAWPWRSEGSIRASPISRTGTSGFAWRAGPASITAP